MSFDMHVVGSVTACVYMACCRLTHNGDQPVDYCARLTTNKTRMCWHCMVTFSDRLTGRNAEEVEHSRHETHELFWMQKTSQNVDCCNDNDEHGIGTGPRVLRRLYNDSDGDCKHENGVGCAHVASDRHLSIWLAPSHTHTISIIKHCMPCQLKKPPTTLAASITSVTSKSVCYQQQQSRCRSRHACISCCTAHAHHQYDSHLHQTACGLAGALPIHHHQSCVAGL